MDDNPRTKTVPVSALRFTVDSFELGDNGDDAKTAPFRMVARSGQPIEHWYWGNIVHDLSGVRHKGKVPIDYAHDDKEIIGYANHFSTESGNLEVSGALVPYRGSDRATEVIYKQKQGVPYEASINFGGSGIRIEQVAEGESAEVNGYTLDGPAVVVREWPLRGVAVCPYGADANTSTEFSCTEQVEVEVMSKDNTAVVEAAQAVEDDTVDNTAAEAAELVEKPEPAAVEVAAELTEEAKPDGLRFLESFGDRGGVWFAQGLTFEESQQKYLAELEEENMDLREKLKAAEAAVGVEEPVSFSEAQPPRKPEPMVRIAGKQYD